MFSFKIGLTITSARGWVDLLQPASGQFSSSPTIQHLSLLDPTLKPVLVLSRFFNFKVSLTYVLKDLPSGMFAGAKIPSKVRARTLIEMSFSLRTIDLDFTTGTFSTSGWMTLEWDDPRYWLQR